MRRVLLALCLGLAFTACDTNPPPPPSTPPTPQSEPAGEYDEHGLLIPGEPNTDRTVPTSPYENPTMSLIEQEQASRNSLASQEVNRWLNQVFQEPEKTPLPSITLIATVLILALGELWQHRGVLGSIASAIGGILSSTQGRRIWSKFWVWVGRISGLWTLFQIVTYVGGWA